MQIRVVETNLKLDPKYIHDWDDDGVCFKCGFDGAEWWHWKHNTYEGRASDIKQPLCKGR